jgi:hypothetical protein
MSLRKAINAKCRVCIHETLDKGSAAQQIACCTISECPLHFVRPITATLIPQQLLDHWRISIDLLCERARLLVKTAPSCPEDDQMEPLQDVKSKTYTKVLVTEGEP